MRVRSVILTGSALLPFTVVTLIPIPHDVILSLIAKLLL
jgi:hypothetical protein